MLKMSRLGLLLLGIVYILGTATPVLAVGPGKGDMMHTDMWIGDCYGSVVVRWDLDSLLGEPLVKGSWKYFGADCKPSHSTIVWLKVEAPGIGHSYVRLAPVVPNKASEWGFNTPGSPNWDEVLCGYRGTRTLQCLEPNDAKRVWRNGSVTDFEVVW